METNPLKMKPYYLSTFTKSLKTPSCKTMQQWSFKKTMSKWTSMPGCTIRKIALYSDLIHSFDWKSAIEHDGGV